MSAVDEGAPQGDVPGEELARLEDGERMELVAEVAGREGTLVGQVGCDDGPEEQQAQAAQEEDGQQISNPRAADGLGHVLTSVGTANMSEHRRSHNLPQTRRVDKDAVRDHTKGGGLEEP